MTWRDRGTIIGIVGIIVGLLGIGTTILVANSNSAGDIIINLLDFTDNREMEQAEIDVRIKDAEIKGFDAGSADLEQRIDDLEQRLEDAKAEGFAEGIDQAMNKLEPRINERIDQGITGATEELEERIATGIAKAAAELEPYIADARMQGYDQGIAEAECDTIIICEPLAKPK